MHMQDSKRAISLGAQISKEILNKKNFTEGIVNS